MKQENNGLGHRWKIIPLPMKIMLITLDAGFLLAVLYYFNFI
jgi:hypothetical protein